MKYFVAFIFSIIMCFVSFAQNVFITKPYVQIGHQPNNQSMQVIWHSVDSNENWKIEHFDTQKKNWVTSDSLYYTRVNITGIIPQRVYHASLNGLIAGQKFLYRISRSSTIVFTETAQAIKSSEQPFRFVALGDIGAEKIGCSGISN